MPQSPDFYTTHAAIIESALAHASRAHRLAPVATDEFCSWARVRLLDHDQAILRKFQERSSLRTFLVTAVAHPLRQAQIDGDIDIGRAGHVRGVAAGFGRSLVHWILQRPVIYRRFTMRMLMAPA